MARGVTVAGWEGRAPALSGGLAGLGLEMMLGRPALWSSPWAGGHCAGGGWSGETSGTFQVVSDTTGSLVAEWGGGRLGARWADGGSGLKGVLPHLHNVLGNICPQEK